MFLGNCKNVLTCSGSQEKASFTHPVVRIQNVRLKHVEKYFSKGFCGIAVTESNSTERK